MVRSGKTAVQAASVSKRMAIVMVAVAGELAASCSRSRGKPLIEHDGLQILSGYTYPTMGTAGAAYVQIHNGASSADTLLEVLIDGQSGMLMTTEGASMVMVPRAAIPAGSDVSMRPGGMHLMFEGLKAATAVGDTVPLTLRFARAGELGVRVPVVAYGELP